MKRIAAGLAFAALALAPLASRAACPKNPAKPTRVEGKLVKRGSCGPFMMHAEDVSRGYYECTDAKGKALKALYLDCKQTNAAAPKKPAPGKPGKRPPLG